MGLYFHAQGIGALVIEETPPSVRFLRKDDRPLIGLWNHVQSVTACRQALSFNLNGIGNGKNRVFICASAPGVWFPISERAEVCESVGHQTAPNFAPAICTIRGVNR